VSGLLHMSVPSARRVTASAVHARPAAVNYSLASSTSTGGLLRHSRVQTSTQHPLAMPEGSLAHGCATCWAAHVPNGRKAVLGAGTVTGMLHMLVPVLDVRRVGQCMLEQQH
jgi:hypothetical protein